MDEKERGRKEVVEHLRILIRVIERMGYNGFMIKAMSIFFYTAVLVLVYILIPTWHVALVLLISPTITIIYWLVDGRCLLRERLFRNRYDEVREQESTNFKMLQLPVTNKPPRKYIYFTIDLIMFYGILQLAISIYILLTRILIVN